MPRPETPVSKHEGYHWHARPAAPYWRIHTRGMLCRFLSNRVRCTNLAVADVMRPWQGVAGRWWAYCPEHMYGRWIEDGAVLEWILREDEAVPDGV